MEFSQVREDIGSENFKSDLKSRLCGKDQAMGGSRTRINLGMRTRASPRLYREHCRGQAWRGARLPRQWGEKGTGRCSTCRDQMDRGTPPPSSSYREKPEQTCTVTM